MEPHSIVVISGRKGKPRKLGHPGENAEGDGRRDGPGSWCQARNHCNGAHDQGWRTEDREKMQPAPHGRRRRKTNRHRIGCD